MIEPTKEQIKEFWEWCRFTQSRIQIPLVNVDRPDGTWNTPDGIDTGELDLPRIDLNNLFAIVSRLTEAGYHIETRTYTRKVDGVLGRCSWVNITKDGELIACRSSVLKLEDALFWAIYEVIKYKRVARP